jgi:hypothetical protein
MLISQNIAGVEQSQFQFLWFRAIVEPVAFETGPTSDPYMMRIVIVELFP